MIRHMKWNIVGALKRSDKELDGTMQYEDGRFLTGAQVRKYLQKCLVKGWRVLPLGNCEGFDYQKGCPGHPNEKEENES